MAENLDPESIRQFNESMRELNNVMPALITGLGQLSGVASGSTKVQDALNKHANAVKGMTELEQSNIDAQKNLWWSNIEGEGYKGSQINIF
jgi:hypothetical protein